MTTYNKPVEIKRSMQNLIDAHLDDCNDCDELFPNFRDLIKHNFLGKSVCCNKLNQIIEIGIEDNTGDEDFYPQILVLNTN